MPIVHVELFEGRSVEQKRELTKGISDVVAEVTGNDPNYIHVILVEHNKNNWCRDSKLAIDREK